MAAPFDTLLLDVGTWDLTLDASNNIAVATATYSVAQDMSSQCRQWRREYIFDQSAGVPLASILGESPSLALVKSDFAQAAGQVPGTNNVVCFISAVKDRNVQGQVQGTVTLATGTTTVAAPISGAHTP
jgi:predicted transcriptional regulator